MKLTKQGVRDLNDIGKKTKRKTYTLPPKQCNHKRMKECHPGCGHLECPDCGLAWDTYAEL